MRSGLICPFFARAFGAAVPIGGLAGLIGLGGGEFRLPVLVHAIGFGARSAVPLNLLVSLATLSFALLTRAWTAPPLVIGAHLPEIAGLALGGVASALHGARLVSRLSDRRLVRIIAVLLAALGLLLAIETLLPVDMAGLAPEGAAWRLLLGAAIGVVVGIVSSMLGVAGGELLIPALMIVFGADIRTAGTASALIAIVIVSVGLWRYHRLGLLALTRGARRIGTAMTLGSMLGAGLGGLALAFAPVLALKVVLGAILVMAAALTWYKAAG
jgi:uncharacterized membrane protein YfcA